jgi:alpha-soluble NSF attachment protein
MKIATFCSQLEPNQPGHDYAKAVQIFEQVGEASLESNLLKFNAKGHFFSAGICVLAQAVRVRAHQEFSYAVVYDAHDRLLVQDTVAMRQKLERFSEMDYSFGDSREGKFLEVCDLLCVGYPSTADHTTTHAVCR